MYVCGMTVYDFLHIGHARMMTVLDIVQRYLRYRGYKVTYVRNITDIDDKIIKRAAHNGEPIDALTGLFIQATIEVCAQLAIARPDHEPRATQYVPDMITMIGTLIDKGYAYAAANGDVMYSVAKFEGYGRLSGKNLADLRAGARIEVDEFKRDPLDFVLWKHAKPGEPSWDSPWGPGRPCWVRFLTSSAGGWISSFPITRMRSRSLARPQATGLSTSGCTTGLSMSLARRCRSHSATSLRYGTCCRRCGI